MFLRIPARRLPPLLAVRLCQPEAEAAFLYLEALTAELVVIGHPAQVGMAFRVSGEPTLEPRIVGEDLNGVAGLREVDVLRGLGQKNLLESDLSSLFLTHRINF